jgi:mRNA-degrading endonuclease RelE of RelBE toxin-antitoxin system
MSRRDGSTASTKSLAMTEAEPYRVVLSRRAVKDVESLPPKVRKKLGEMLRCMVAIQPTCGKKLVGDLQGYWSLRLTLKDRIVYRIEEESHTVIVLRARSHYEV